MLSIDFIKEWCINKIEYLKNQALKERTSCDGIVIIAVSGSIILFGGLIKLIAWLALAYGVYTLVKEEGFNPLDY